MPLGSGKQLVVCSVFESEELLKSFVATRKDKMVKALDEFLVSTEVAFEKISFNGFVASN